MGKLLEMLPIINIFNWASGEEYMTEENTTVLPPELAESDQKTDELADKHFSTPAKAKTGKGKKIEGIAVKKEQLNKKVETKVQQDNVQETGRDER